jgi:hypothetical protein
VGAEGNFREKGKTVQIHSYIQKISVEPMSGRRGNGIPSSKFSSFRLSVFTHKNQWRGEHNTTIQAVIVISTSQPEIQPYPFVDSINQIFKRKRLVETTFWLMV